MDGLTELEEKRGLVAKEKERLLSAIKDFSLWLKEKKVTTKAFGVENIKIEPFSSEDWIMRVNYAKSNEPIVSFNPSIINKCSFEFFEVVILHEYFHLVVQGVPNKDDATKIKDGFGSDFMSLIDIEADFYVAYYLKDRRELDLESYWKLYYGGSTVFIDKWIRNKKFERFLGSVLTVDRLFQSKKNCFDLYLPSISGVFTQEKMSVLKIKREHIIFEEYKIKLEDFTDIKKLYLKPSHFNFEGYYEIITNFTNTAFNK